LTGMHISIDLDRALLIALRFSQKFCILTHAQD
jgi:hypothetical protein